uniref:Pentatricopeptide repeat-containing protein At5g61370, mitochondrial n=1 Tax=Anthurium amnicola TaxID=1678845 RepID=A0A1D1Z9S4_9ARAE
MEAAALRLTRRTSPWFPLRYFHHRRHYHEHPHEPRQLPPPPPHSSDSSLFQRIRDIVFSGVGGLDDMESALDQLRSPVPPSLVAQVFGSCPHPVSPAGSGVGDTRRLLRFFSWCRRKAGGGDRWGEAFSCAIRTLAERNDAPAMGILVSDHQRERREMDLDTFSCVVESLVKSGREDDAVRLFRMLENNEQQQEQQGGGCRSRRVVAIVHALCARGHARKAHAVVWHHRDKLGPAEKPTVYFSLLHGWCVGRNAREARKVLEEMKSAGLRPGLASYNTFLRCVCERNLKFNPSALIPEGFSVMAEMRTAGVPPTAVSFNILLSCLVRARRVKEACKVLHSMRTREAGRPAPDWVSYYLVVRVLYLTGRLIRGNRVIRQMLLEDGLVAKAWFFRSLIGLLCGVENVGIALEVFDHMKRSYVQDCGPVYDLLIAKLCKSGKFEVGKRLWDEAVEKGILLRCSSDLLDPSKTEIFKPTKNIDRLDAEDAECLLNKKVKKRKRTIRISTKKRRKKKSCST